MSGVSISFLDNDKQGNQLPLRRTIVSVEQALDEGD